MARASDRPSVYMVVWDDDCIVKVGFTSRGRWRSFVKRGGRLVALDVYDTELQALECEDRLHKACPYRRAFTAREQAVPYLGNTGGGWLECYRFEKGDFDGR